jgi:DNA polymerase epsilon subunit 1
MDELVIALVLTVYLHSATTGFDLFDDEIINEQRPNGNMQASDFIVDIREYDVPYHVRVSIDKGM